jgi:hypothetical protein
MDWLAPFQSGQRLNGLSSLLLGDPQVVKALEIQPELRAGSEEMSEAQSGIAGDGASSVQDLRDAIGRHVHFARQFRRAQVNRFQLFGKVFTRMDSRHRHNDKDIGTLLTKEGNGIADERSRPVLLAVAASATSGRHTFSLFGRFHL